MAATQSSQHHDNNDNDDKSTSRWDVANDFKTEGNAAFSQGNFHAALAAYDAGIQALQPRQQDDDNKDKDNTISLSLSSSSSCFYLDLQVNLWSNRAMAQIRLQQFGAAEASCTYILETLQVPYPKAYHRRAMARQGMAALAVGSSSSSSSSSSSNTQQQQQQQSIAMKLLQAAKTDLQAALSVLDQQQQQQQSKESPSPLSAQEYMKQKLAVATAAKRLQQRITATQQQQQQQQAAVQQNQTNKKDDTSPLRVETPHSLSLPAVAARTPPRVVSRRTRRPVPPVVAVHGTLPSTTTTTTTLPPPLRSRVQQRQDVMRLLLSRQTQLRTRTAVVDEAFYIVDWYWWFDFCRHVDLFYRQENNGQKQKEMVLKSLPHGTIVPGELEDDDQDAMDKDVDDYDGPPGPIDNAALFLVPPHTSTGNDNTTAQDAELGHLVYYRQWHRILSQRQRDGESDDDGDPSEPQLVPNLVRGYDYEIVPREVYHALREWYGEVTPSILRRAFPTGNNNNNNTMSVALYPQIQQPISPVLPWNTKLYDRCGACRRPGVRLRCRQCLAMYYCDRTCQQSNWPYHKQYCQPVSTGETPTFVAQSQGRVGLISLGNTCFMNSALQCLSHTAPLTRHFLSGRYTADLNRTNPLGTSGKLADAYAAVLKDLWMRPGAKQVKPYALKRAIALFAPRFAGTLQHDAQEFLAYLLDGLHEDLNRIRQAPYVEMPDFRDGQNMGVAGARAWEAHKRRNDSLVLDTMYGQFKSTCVCPRCNRVSVSFDAFNHVSLEIPQHEPLVPLIVVVVRAAAKSSGPFLPERYAIHFRKSNPMGEFKRDLSQHCGIPFANLHLCGVRNHEVVHIFENNENAMNVRGTDFLVAYEADPFNKPCFHALVRNRTQETDNDNSLGGELFGLPLLTSFPTTYTCRQVWQHFAHLSQDKVKDPKDLASVLRVVYHDNHDNPMEIFPLDTSPEKQTSEDPAGETKTAVVPKDLDEPIIKFLGTQAQDSFLPLGLEWSDVRLSDSAETEKENERRVDENSFIQVRDHPSYLEAMEKLRLEGNKKKGVTLDECFQTFIKPERLDERNMWYCSKCKDHVRAMKTMELWRLPDVLVVHLKRFEFRNVLRRDKLETFVDFPVESLDMSQYCGSNQQTGFVNEHIPSTYDLFGVVNHYGRMGFGHYTSFCREWNELGEMGSWSLFDDANVSSVVGNKVVSPAAYVLFYRRRVG